MKKVFLKRMLLIAVAVVLLALVCGNTTVSAVNYEVQMLEKGEKNYLLYIEGLLDETYEFAFLNDNESYDLATLTYYDSALDAVDGNSIAFINEEIYNNFFDGKTKTFISIKQNGTHLVEALEVKVAEALSETEIVEMNALTKRIPIEIATKVTEVEKDGVAVKETTGTIDIKDRTDGKYSYVIEIIKAGSENEKLVKLFDDMNNIEGKNIFEQIKLYNEVKTVYANLEPKNDSTNWVELAKDGVIESPKGTVSGDKYIVWIKQDNGVVIDKDIQIMTSLNEKDEAYEKEKVVTFETTKLPITGDSYVLFIIGASLLVLIIALVIVKVNNKKKDEK